MDTASYAYHPDFASSPPHPLIYASLVPWHSSKGLLRLDLHKPKSTYSIGRAPSNDFTFENRKISWIFGSLTWDGGHEIHLTLDKSAVSTVWVNYKLLKPGHSILLKEGDQIRIGSVEHRREKDAFFSRDLVYVFHQFTSTYPATLSSQHLETRKRLDELEQERARILRSLPDVPAVPRYDFFRDYNEMRSLNKETSSWPDDPKIDQPDCHKRVNEYFGTLRVNPPPPIRTRADVRTLSFGYDGESVHGIDWNDPDLVWKGHIYLDRSRPLTIPVSIIHWSNVHRLPVYLHPEFNPALTATTAYPHAAFSANFSDESAAPELVKEYPTSDELPELLQKYLKKRARGHEDTAIDTTPSPSSPLEPTITRSPSTTSHSKRRRLQEGFEDAIKDETANHSPLPADAAQPVSAPLSLSSKGLPTECLRQALSRACCKDNTRCT
ncbi:unnamed protein product [Peniophora sp. CBMAI 1063]|nr:unnamed protein product [Peniophora sp. CBMAI 1063]